MPAVFNRVEVGAVGRKVEEVAFDMFDEFFGFWGFMEGCVVEDYGLAGLELGDEALLKPLVEKTGIGMSLKPHGSNKGVLA
jgi:hypothetical protein